MKRIIIKDLLGIDIRSRANARKIKEDLEKETSKILDLNGVVFISRSFADELINISEKFNAKIENADNEVQTMLSIVSKSRAMHSAQIKVSDNIMELKDMHSVNDFFSMLR